jgi:hypothetical protein
MEKREISLFVVGLPRSGTKMLREILNKHSEIYIPTIEAHFVVDLLEKYNGKILVSQDISQIIHRVRQSLFFFYYANKNMFDFSTIAVEGDSIQTVITNIWNQFKSLDGYKEKTILGDKTPSNISQIELIHAGFPEARIIHIVRDPRDVALSSRQKWNKNTYRTVYKWQKAIQHFNKVVRNLPTLNYLQVKYEDIISEPEHHLGIVCEFLGINFEKEMLELSSTTSIEKNYIDTANRKKYLKLEKNVLYRMEAYTFEELKMYNYDVLNEDLKVTKSPSRLRLNIWQYLDMLNIIIHNFSEYGFMRGIEKTFKASKNRL